MTESPAPPGAAPPDADAVAPFAGDPFVGGLSEARRERLRQQHKDAIPAGYSPWRHLLLPSTFGLLTIAYGLLQLSSDPGLALIAAPALFLVANAAEWRLHRDLLHKRTWPVAFLYDQHTPMHHMVYVDGDMGMRDFRELAFILFPLWSPLALAVGVAPLAFGIGALFGADTAWIFFASCMAYLISYEWLHLSYHLPEGSRVGRLRLVRWLARHHEIHHDPQLMQRFNFNVNLPLWDWVRGTTAPRTARRDRRPGGVGERPGAAAGAGRA